MSVQSEETATALGFQVCNIGQIRSLSQADKLTPDFDFVIVASGDEESAGGVDGYAADGACSRGRRSAGTGTVRWEIAPSCSSNLSTRTPIR